MEKADNVYVRCGEFGWSDVGTWGSVYQHSRKDRYANAVPEEGCYLYETRSSIVSLPKDKIAVISGLKEYIVVDTDDVLMICPPFRGAEHQEIHRRGQVPQRRQTYLIPRPKTGSHVKKANHSMWFAFCIEKSGSTAAPVRTLIHFSPLPDRSFTWLTKYLGKTPNCFWKHLAKYDAELNPVI